MKVLKIISEFRTWRLTLHMVSQPQNPEFGRLLMHLTFIFSLTLSKNNFIMDIDHLKLALIFCNSNWKAFVIWLIVHISPRALIVSY